MTARISHQDTLELQDVIMIGGDIILLPEQGELLYEVVHALRVTGIISSELTMPNLIGEVDELFQQYRNQRFTANCEPAWINTLPTSVKKYFRAKYVSTPEQVFVEANELPYSGIRYQIERGGLCEATCSLFKLNRLKRINQLGYLQFPRPVDINKRRSQLSQTSRYQHSIDVRVIVALIMHNLGLPVSVCNTGSFVALTHDMGTPAGGDSVKHVDPQALDEEQSFSSLLTGFDWIDFQSAYGISGATAIDAVKNRGLIGRILDVADKIAYVGRDLHACVGHVRAASEDNKHPGLESLMRKATRYPNVCSIWDSITLHENELVFTDAQRLVMFLQVRALLFREMYYHHYARFGEYLVSRVLVKYLYRRGKITREDLLDWDDDQLMKRLDKEYGRSNVMETIFTGFSRCKGFASRNEAEFFIRKLKSEGNVFTLLEDSSRRIITGSKWLVQTKFGPQPLWQAYPGDVREIEEMAGTLPMAYVYYLEDDPPLSRKFLARIQKSLRNDD